jgi:hypothetical protein
MAIRNTNETGNILWCIIPYLKYANDFFLNLKIPKILITLFLGGIRHVTADDFAVLQLQLSGASSAL